MNSMDSRGYREFTSFEEAQYTALRQEILALKEQSVRIAAVGVSGIPFLAGLSEKLGFGHEIIFAIPLISVAFLLMLMYTQMSLMRAGKYICDWIERPLGYDDEKNQRLGWEHWIQENRPADCVFMVAALIVFAVYFGAGAYFSITITANAPVTASRTSLTSLVPWLTGIYAAIAIVTVLAIAGWIANLLDWEFQSLIHRAFGRKGNEPTVR